MAENEPTAREMSPADHLAAFEDFLAYTQSAMQNTAFWLTLNQTLIGGPRGNKVEEYQKLQDQQASDIEENLRAASEYLAWLKQNGLALTVEIPDGEPLLLRGLHYNNTTHCYSAPVFTVEGPMLLPLDGTHRLNIVQGPPVPAPIIEMFRR